jgi:branched-subunit amino acid transport protein AzlD
MNRDVLIGSLILLLVSILVRVIPTFVKLKLSERSEANIKEILPIAVFVNLLIYCVVSESSSATTASLISFFILLTLLLMKRINLLVTVTVASICYMIIR